MNEDAVLHGTVNEAYRAMVISACFWPSGNALELRFPNVCLCTAPNGDSLITHAKIK